MNMEKLSRLVPLSFPAGPFYATRGVCLAPAYVAMQYS
jgi:hypothetical protein